MCLVFKNLFARVGDLDGLVWTYLWRNRKAEIFILWDAFVCMSISVGKFVNVDCTVFSFAELRRVLSSSSRHFLWSRVVKVIFKKYEFKIIYLATKWWFITTPSFAWRKWLQNMHHQLINWLCRKKMPLRFQIKSILAYLSSERNIC